MGDLKDLSHDEAIAKIKEIVDDTPIGMFLTHLSEPPLSARPMSTQRVDEDGCLWFFSPKESEKNHDIEQDTRVQLLYANTKRSEFLSIYGTAAISTDREMIEELWTPMVKTWFQEGKDDPSITLIKVTPEDAYYWDTKNNRLVSLIKIMASTVSGKTMDDSIQGNLRV